MKYIDFKSDGQRDKDDGEYFYQCLNCNQKWKLKDPDNSAKGYFKVV
jgi:hypothetical protein